jgi:thymidine kinase
MKGKIDLIIGPMFSGKTTELRRRLRRYTLANKKCVAIKYSGDKRYSTDSVVTHDDQKTPATVTTVLCDLKWDADNTPDVIGVDEGQFFVDLVEFCERETKRGAVVIVAGLDGTHERKPFGSITTLVPLVDGDLTKLTAVCMDCGEDAAFTKRITADTQVELIGGSEIYRAVCRDCYYSYES